MTTITRAAWGARPARSGPGDLDPAQVEGIALHWPGFGADQVPPHTELGDVARLLRGWQAYHMDTKGWSDIAYQEAVDQAGRIYELRGLRTQSGANGDEDVNQRFGALLLVLGPGERPTPAMVATVRGRVAAHRRLFPRSRSVVGHSHIRPEPTSCPGPVVLGMLTAGDFDVDQVDELTRGEHVDDALAELRHAEGSGRRQTLIKRARRALRRIKPWKA